MTVLLHLWQGPQEQLILTIAMMWIV